MKSLKLLTLALAAALPLVAGVRPAAAAEITPIAQAVGEAEPFVISWVDTADGKVGIDAARITAAFSSVRYIFTDQGQLLLGQMQGQELKLVLPAAHMLKNEKNTYFLAHVRSADKTLFLDGSAVRYASDPTKGYAEWTLLTVGKDGSTVSTHIEQELAFQSGSSNPTPPPSGSLIQGRSRSGGTVRTSTGG
jgi:hypothetical protein